MLPCIFSRPSWTSGSSSRPGWPMPISVLSKTVTAGKSPAPCSRRCSGPTHGTDDEGDEDLIRHGQGLWLPAEPVDSSGRTWLRLWRPGAMRLPAWCGRLRESIRFARPGHAPGLWRRDRPREPCRPRWRASSRLPRRRLHAGVGAAAVLRGESARRGERRPGVRRPDRPRRCWSHVSSLAAAGPAIDGRPKTEADPAGARLALWPQQAGGRTGRRTLRRPRAHHHRPPAHRAGRSRPLGPAVVPLRLLASASTWCRGFDRRRFSLIHADDLVQSADSGRRARQAVAAARAARVARPRRAITSPPAKRIPTYADLGRMVAEAMGRHLVLVIPTVTPLVWMVAVAGEAISRHPARSAVHEPRQGPRNHRRQLALLGPGGRRRVGFRRGPRSLHTACVNDRMVPSGRVAESVLPCLEHAQMINCPS